MAGNGGCPACGGRVTQADTCPACVGDGEISRVGRKGVSVFPSLQGLIRHLVARDVDVEGKVIVEVAGELSGDRDLDADSGALLVLPDAIVAVHSIDPAGVAAVRRRLV